MIRFSLQELIRYGLLGGVHSLMERAEVRACLGAPDDWMLPSDGAKTVDRAPIWRYGNFEVHFFLDDTVSLLFTDYLDGLEAGRHRRLDLWFLDALPDRSLASVRDVLTAQHIAYTETMNRIGNPILGILEGADLVFDAWEGTWQWGAIVVDTTKYRREVAVDGFEKVYTATDWYDGPRGGIASFGGRPHRYQSTFEDMAGGEDTYLLSPVNEETFAWALEAWQIWLRWERAFLAGRTTGSTHPALPEERLRYDELQTKLGEMANRGREPHSVRPADGNNALDSPLRATATFKSIGCHNGHASCYVKWTPC